MTATSDDPDFLPPRKDRLLRERVHEWFDLDYESPYMLLVADVSGHGREVSEIAVTLRDLMRRFVNYLDQSRFVEELVRRALPGLALTHLPVPPAAVSPRVSGRTRCRTYTSKRGNTPPTRKSTRQLLPMGRACESSATSAPPSGMPQNMPAAVRARCCGALTSTASAEMFGSAAPKPTPESRRARKNAA
mgnify:CR=1 FL=1